MKARQVIKVIKARIGLLKATCAARGKRCRTPPTNDSESPFEFVRFSEALMRQGIDVAAPKTSWKSVLGEVGDVLIATC